MKPTVDRLIDHHNCADDILDRVNDPSQHRFQFSGPFFLRCGNKVIRIPLRLLYYELGGT